MAKTLLTVRNIDGHPVDAETLVDAQGNDVTDPNTGQRASAGLLLRAAVFCCALLAPVLAAACQANAADAPLRLRTVWGMPNHGIVRFCYRSGESPAVIYFRYNQTSNRTSIVKRDVSTDEHVLAEFSGRAKGRSLSCSDDGETIAAFDEDEQVLLVARGKDTALYRLSQSGSFANAGVYLLLSPDGSSMALPATDRKGRALPLPELISGRDLLKDIRIFKYSWGNKPFLRRDQIYAEAVKKSDDRGNFRGKIVRYRYVENEWRAQEQFAEPQNFGVYDIATCGSHDIATLSNDEQTRFVVLNKASPARRDWLETIGVRRALRQRPSFHSITSRYSTCAVPLYRRGDDLELIAEGLLRFDDQGMKSFSFFPERQIALGDDEVSFSRDGCYALIQMFDQIPAVPQFTLPQQARLLQVESEQCR
jgi:hypothetical protein